MHASSYDRMAEFCHDYLAARQDEPLTIVDLGSCDYNGSYRPIFARKPWHYLGVDLAPGKNVDLVLREAYHWRELQSDSVDVLVSGQTFEHTEFFWETILEITRVLKPGGLCCIIAPASGPEHRFSLDCWRIFADGFRALARYSALEVLHAHTHWEELAKYNDESNKWHESILIARKRPESLGERIRRRLFAAARRRLHPLPQRDETLIQVFRGGPTGAEALASGRGVGCGGRRAGRLAGGADQPAGPRPRLSFADRFHAHPRFRRNCKAERERGDTGVFFSGKRGRV